MTATSYEGYQLEKLPFAMKAMSLLIMGDSFKIANKVFYPNTIGKQILYSTKDRTGYLLISQKKDIVGFIISPDGKNWSCYYKYTKKGKEKVIPPFNDGSEEAAGLMELIAKLPEPGTSYFYITYSSYDRNMITTFSKDSLSVIFTSPDTLKVGGYIFSKKGEKLYVGSGSYLYMPDNSTMVFRDRDASNWATFYKSDKVQANELIGKEYKFEKELDAANNSVSGRGQSSLNTYFSSLRTQRNDPALSTAILKYWNTRWPGSPATKVIFMNADLFITKNNLGVPLRRSITAWVEYKKDGKCCMQWHQWGYEALGGGNFAKVLSQWQMNYVDYYIEAKNQYGSQWLHSGDELEVNCTVIK